jgi:hypothetical protein
MNSEMIAARLAEAEARWSRINADVVEARNELAQSQDGYGRTNSPANLARLKGSQSKVDALVNLLWQVEQDVNSLRAELETANANEANEQLIEFLVAKATKANYEYSVFLQARQDASDLMVQAARRMQDISSSLHQTRNDFLVQAGVVANMSRDRKSPESDALRAELEKRVGSLSGLTAYWAGMEHAWSEPVRFEPLPLEDMVALLQRAKIEPEEAADQAQWAESEGIEPAIAEMA